MKRKKPEAELEPQKFSVGETVRILRSHLWADCVGEVVSFREGKHLVKIKNKHDDKTMPFFHTEACASQLESFI